MDSLKKIIAETFSVSIDSIGENLVLRDLESWDSFNHMVFIVAVEQKFGVELSADEIIRMQSYKDAREILTGKLQAA